jgi:hypothetical protein
MPISQQDAIRAEWSEVNRQITQTKAGFMNNNALAALGSLATSVMAGVISSASLFSNPQYGERVVPVAIVTASVAAMGLFRAWRNLHRLEQLGDKKHSLATQRRQLRQFKGPNP